MLYSYVTAGTTGIVELSPVRVNQEVYLCPAGPQKTQLSQSLSHRRRPWPRAQGFHPGSQLLQGPRVHSCSRVPGLTAAIQPGHRTGNEILMRGPAADPGACVTILLRHWLGVHSYVNVPRPMSAASSTQRAWRGAKEFCSGSRGLGGGAP